MAGIAVAITLLATSCVARTVPDPTPVPTTETKPKCPAPGVTVSAGAVDAAMGLRVMTLTMTNCGADAYTVDGYPAVRVLDEDRAEVTVEVGNGTAGIATVPPFDNPPAPVMLKPGETATSGLLWRNLVTDATVPATVGSYLEVSPAPGDPWQRLAETDLNIDLGNTGKLGVRAWTVSP